MRTSLNNEHDIRRHVSLLKNFYGEFTAYVVVCIAAILVWVLQDFGYFWPRWVIVIWGASLILKASKLEIIDRKVYEFFHGLRDRLPFMHKNWEEDKVQELMESVGLKKSATSSNSQNAAKKEVHQSTQSLNSAVNKGANSVKDTASKVEQKVAPKPAVKSSAAQGKSTAKKPTSKVSKPSGKSSNKPNAKAGTKPGNTSNNKPGSTAKPKAPGAPKKK